MPLARSPSALVSPAFSPAPAPAFPGFVRPTAVLALVFARALARVFAPVYARVSSLAFAVVLALAIPPAVAAPERSATAPGASGTAAAAAFAAALEYAGAERVAYGEERYAEIRWPSANGRTPLTLAGAVRTSVFRLPAPATPAEAYRDYEQALARAGYVVRARCVLDDCYRGPQLQRALDAAFDGRRVIASTGWPSAQGELRYGSEPHVLIAEHANTDRREWVAIHVYRARVDYAVAAARQQPMAAILAVAIAPPEVGRVRAWTAAALAEALERDGVADLYGVRFAADGARVESSSRTDVETVAGMLRARPTMRIYVVAHSRDGPDAEAAVARSQARARAFTAALVEAGVAAARVSGHGIGPFSPGLAPDGADERITLVRRRPP